MKSLYILSFSIFFSGFLTAQSETSQKRSTEIGMNITNTLAGFFNSGGSDLPKDPYLFSLKFADSRGALRFGLNFSVKKESEFPLTGNRDITENKFFGRGGYEWRSVIDKRFTLYYGIDAVVEYENERLDFDSFGFDDLGSSDNSYGFGGGPVLGIQYSLTKRVRLATEGWIYGVVRYHTSKTDIGNGLPPREENSTDFYLSPAVPTSLYFIFTF